jgi:hypothetical protein
MRDNKSTTSTPITRLLLSNIYNPTGLEQSNQVCVCGSKVGQLHPLCTFPLCCHHSPRRVGASISYQPLFIACRSPPSPCVFGHHPSGNFLDLRVVEVRDLSPTIKKSFSCGCRNDADDSGNSCKENIVCPHG